MALISRLDQLRQIKSSNNQTDIDLGITNSDRSTIVSGAVSLQDDLNQLRSQILDILGSGSTKWSDIPMTTLSETVGVSKKLLIQGIQTELIGVSSKSFVLIQQNSINGSSLTSDVGIVNEPFNGSLNIDSKARAILRDKTTNNVILDSNEREVFGIIQHQDPAINPSGLEINFFVDVNGVLSPIIVNGDIEVIIPDRQKLSDISETALFSNAGFAGAVGSLELGSRIYNDISLTDGTGNIFGFTENEDITKTINKLSLISGNNKNINDNFANISGISGIGFNTTFKTDNTTSYLADNDSLYEAIRKLDIQAKINNTTALNASADKVIKIISQSVSEGTPIIIPNSKIYDNLNKDSLDVFVNGQLLVSDVIAGGTGQGDYSESSNSEVTFHMPIEIGDVITFKIFKS